MLKKIALIVALIAVMPVLVFGQGRTTASFNGVVLTKSGEPLVGANVVAVHEPTGTIYGAATRSDGRFNITGVRVGGPYTITASYIGYHSAKRENVYLALAQDLRVNFNLVEEAISLSEIVTVAERDEVLTASNTGTATHVTTAQIERLPTIQRTIQDFTRLTPQVNSAAGGQSIAGKNNRMNNFQVDGAVLNDAFGLAATGTPGGQADVQPISLDAIQEFNVEVAPFDVRSGSFAGGLIDAITRSGTNQFEGSGYFYGRNESFVGDLEGNNFQDFSDFQTGFRFGGPIAQNKAFFFVNGEIRQKNQPTNVGLNDPNAAINFPVPQSDIQRIIDIAKTKYGYDPGGFDPFTIENNDVKLFARLDFNLAKNHRLTIRHNLVDGFLDRGLIRNSSLFTLESNQYEFDTNTNSTVIQLNSTFSNRLANEARVSYTRIRDKRNPLFGAFPQVLINAGPGDVRLGVERFSQANALDQDTFELTDNLMYFTGDHTLTFGTHNEFTSFDNLFIQDFFGNYEFDSIEDFENGTPAVYSLSVSKVPGVKKPRANWDYIQLGFYAQDEWKPTPQLNVTAGLRVDIPLLPDDPMRNTLFESQFSGLRTDEVPSGNILWSPRFGFNYDISGNRTTQIRGGAGIFSGTPPAVWLSNQYSNTGVDFFRIFVADFINPDDVPTFSPDPNNQPVVGDVNTPQTSEVNLTDSDFKMPQVLRSNIAIDRQLPQGLVGTLEFLYAKNINDVVFKNLNVGNFGAPVGTLPDGRPDYGGVTTSSDFTRVILLDNTSKGHQLSFTAKISKQLNRGPFKNLFGSLSYTFTEAKDVNSGRSSRAISNWRFLETMDPNNPPVARSDFEVRNRILGNLSYDFKYGKGLGTTISVFYEGRSGAPFSYLFRNDINGDGQRGNDLVYVPQSADELADPSQWDAINTFIQSDDALKDARGKIFGRNKARAPWQNRLDLRIAQRIPSIRHQNFEFTLDVFNVLNLINSDWGQIEFAPFDAISLFDGSGYDANGKLDITLRPRDTNGDGKVTRDDVFSLSDLPSRWQIQLGARYNF